MEAGTGVYAVAEASIRYLRPAKLGDDLLLVSTVKQVRAASVHIRQQVLRGGEPLTEAGVTAAFLTLDGRPTRQPREWVTVFERIRAGGGA
jgi:acyl-CoA thioester hydrolase